MPSRLRSARSCSSSSPHSGCARRSCENDGQYWSKVVRRPSRVVSTLMLKRFLILLGLAALLSAGYAVAAGMTVGLTVDGPQPARATVAWGDTVTFVNSDDKVHQVTIPRLSLESPSISPGGVLRAGVQRAPRQLRLQADRRRPEQARDDRRRPQGLGDAEGVGDDRALGHAAPPDGQVDLPRHARSTSRSGCRGAARPGRRWVPQRRRRTARLPSCSSLSAARSIARRSPPTRLRPARWASRSSRRSRSARFPGVRRSAVR